MLPAGGRTTRRLGEIDDRSYVRKQHACPDCGHHVEEEDLIRNLYVCPSCEYHFRINALERIRMTIDSGVFDEIAGDLPVLNPINFPDYETKVAQARTKSELSEAANIGVGRIHGRQAVVGVMSFQFMGGSMGSAVGERVMRAILEGATRGLAVVLFTASGGARMQEGIFSLMQMAKTSHATTLLDEARQPLIVVLTDPTTGGVTASFAMLGDITLAEPKALIGFAGPRVIEGTIRQKLPEGFQRSEFQLEKGFVDAVVPRSRMKDTLAFLIDSSQGNR
ncbi:MAG: acetyl-CoA carboxylase, carboxyltransferase subunit beta [Spirochaetes bacterium]|jgi:acetyl-CoA carboxylase carboxyl transferase subunit beta|nr:acetyl-CoA carboxylase, carboxyltransferase subunit beta [Spirochaetota bacterium]